MLEKINYKNFLTRTNLLIAFLGILPATGYLVGINFYQGRLSAYGVSSDTFPLALQDIYVEAYWAVALWILPLATGIVAFVKKLITPPDLYWLVIAVLIVLLLFYFLIKRKLRIRNFLRAKLQPVKKVIDYLDWEKNAFTKVVGLTGELSYWPIFGILLFLVFFVCWVGLPVAAYYTGRDSATKTITSYLEKGCYVKSKERWSNCKTLKTADGKLVYEGILVAHTNGYVAIFNNTGSYVTKFPDGGALVNLLPHE